MQFGHRTYDFERVVRERHARQARNDQMIQDWLLLTGETMDETELDRIYRDWDIINRTQMKPRDFERLIFSWSLLTRRMNPKELEYLIQNLPAEDLENLKNDYLVLNWTKMSSTDFELFKDNWLKIAENRGVDSGESVVKLWLLQYVYLDYTYMQMKDKVQYTRMCLERGADVNALRGGYSLLHNLLSVGLTLYPPLLEVLLSFGADVTLRMPPSRETPLEVIRTCYYRYHIDVVSMLQTAEKSARKDALLKSGTNNYVMNEKKKRKIMLDEKTSLERRDLDRIQNSWVEANPPPYMVRLCELFDRTDHADIDSLMFRVINYMYISRIIKTELKFKIPDRNEKIAYMHKIFSRMCTKLFNFFDPQFDRTIEVEFGPTTRISESADLVFLLEIDPEVAWVALKIYAVPWDIEYCVSCKGSSISRFRLQKTFQHGNFFDVTDLIKKYKKYFSEYHQSLI